MRGNTNKQTLSTNLTLHKAYTTTGPALGGQKPKERIQPSSRKEFNFTWSLEKGDFKHNKLRKNYESAKKYYKYEGANQKHRIPNTWRGIDKLPEKQFRIRRVKMIKNLENKMEKMQESINKGLEELKEWKELRIVSETSGTTANAPTLKLQGPLKNERKRKGMRKILRDCSWKLLQHGKGNSQSSPRGSQSPIQDKHKEKHAKTHTNQSNKD